MSLDRDQSSPRISLRINSKMTATLKTQMRAFARSHLKRKVLNADFPPTKMWNFLKARSAIKINVDKYSDICGGIAWRTWMRIIKTSVIQHANLIYENPIFVGSNVLWSTMAGLLSSHIGLPCNHGDDGFAWACSGYPDPQVSSQYTTLRYHVVCVSTEITGDLYKRFGRRLHLFSR